MRKRTTGQVQLWLTLLTVLSAALLGVVIVWFLGDNSQAYRRRLVLGANEATSTAQSPRASAVAGQYPTPTFVPLPTEAPPSPEPPTEALPTEAPPSPEPPTEALPTSVPTSAPVPIRPTSPPAAPVPVSGTQVRLNDDAWTGGYRQARGYGGRSATWIYGTGTEYHTMQAVVALAAQPSGTVRLSIEGMDSEDRAKTPIQITVNGTAIFAGANPLPNDDQPLETGTWATQSWSFDAALLRPGQNVIRIRNQARGTFGLPPFFMLDYADLAFAAASNPPAEQQPTIVPPTPQPQLPEPTSPPLPPAVPPAETSAQIHLNDDAWTGGYRQARGYGGRSATWIYGTGTEYHTMQAVVALAAQPSGTVRLSIEGMDSEDRAKTPIQITVNGTAIFAGANPLPNDDQPLETGTWATQSWSFDAALLRPGQNVIRIRNQARGTFGLPPFFMLDYADLAIP